MIGPVDGDKALDFIVVNPEGFAVGTEKALLAGTMLVGKAHHLKLLGNSEIFMCCRSVAGLQFSKS